jgi:hypothetical protein
MSCSSRLRSRSATADTGLTMVRVSSSAAATPTSAARIATMIVIVTDEWPVDAPSRTSAALRVSMDSISASVRSSNCS